MKKILIAAAAALALTACGSGGGQSDECKKWFECLEGIEAGSSATYDTTYGEDGTCWDTTDLAADACTAACETSTASLATANPDVAACK